MFLRHICQNIDIIAIINDRKNDFGFHGNQQIQGQAIIEQLTGSDGFVNAICHFPTYTPLQPKRIIIKT